MTNSVEFISFDGPAKAAVIQNGSLPEVKFDAGDIILYLCIYNPMGCGNILFLYLCFSCRLYIICLYVNGLEQNSH